LLYVLFDFAIFMNAYACSRDEGEAISSVSYG
jgi:hypothetical protein